MFRRQHAECWLSRPCLSVLRYVTFAFASLLRTPTLRYVSRLLLNSEKGPIWRAPVTAASVGSELRHKGKFQLNVTLFFVLQTSKGRFRTHLRLSSTEHAAFARDRLRREDTLAPSVGYQENASAYN